MASKRPTLTLGGRKGRSTHKGGGRLFEPNSPSTGYVAPDNGSIYANEAPKSVRRMSDTIEDDEEEDVYIPYTVGGVVDGGDESDEHEIGIVNDTTGATPAALQLGRFGHLDQNVQKGVQVLAQGGSITGISKIDAAVAVKAFGRTIEEDPGEWAKQLKIDASTELPRTKQGLKTILSVMQNSEEYLQKGPGSNLAGHTLREDKSAKNDADYQLAMGYIEELADNYIHPATIGTDIYAQKKEALVGSLTDRFLNGVFYDGATSILPMPNETGVVGIKPTDSYRGYAGTKFGRVDFDIYAQENNLTSEDNEYWQHKPNLKGSLFPTGINKNTIQKEKEILKRTQEHLHGQAVYKANFARKVLRERFPTHRDESAGQMNMAGWGRNEGEQAAHRNLLNEASIQGLDFLQASTETTNTFHDPFIVGKGTDRGGKYGQNPLSEVDVFVEGKLEEKESDLPYIEGIRQRTPEWYKAREGAVTASKLINMSGREYTSKELAENLAAERLGVDENFIGNAHTEEGILGEKIALESFLAGQKKLGNELIHTEVGLLTNEKHKGFGVSPDGRLKDKQGNNAGLLELKYLTTGAMDGALKKYTPQIQLQMAITGEEQTHFYAYSKNTGESIHHLVKADKKKQEEILASGSKAMELSKYWSLEDLQRSKNMKQTREQRLSGTTPADEAGQTSSFSVSEGSAPNPMTGFRINRGRPGDDMVSLYEDSVSRAWANSDPAADFISAQESRSNDKKKNNNDEVEKASKQSAASIKELGRQAKAAATAMVELSGVALAGNKSAMEESRLADETGINANKLRGMRKVLELGGVSTSSIDDMFNKSGDLVTGLNNELTGVDKFLELETARATSNLPEIRAMKSFDFTDLKGKDHQQMLGFSLGLLEGKSPEAKTALAKMFGIRSLPTFKGSSEDVLDAWDEELDVPAQLEMLKGVQEFTQPLRDFTEGFGEYGELAGTAAAGIATGGTVLATKTGRKAVKGIGKILTGPASKAIGKVKANRAIKAEAWKNNSPLNNLKASASTASKATRALSIAGKVLPGTALMAVPMAVRSLGGIEDDDSLADSAMDVMEFAAAGAMIGSVIPGAGTIVGAGVGAAVGLAVEATQFFMDDPVPSKDIGPIQGMQSDEATQPTVFNIEVNTSIDKDGVTTEVTENGEQIYLEEDNATGFSQ